MEGWVGYSVLNYSSARARHCFPSFTFSERDRRDRSRSRDRKDRMNSGRRDRDKVYCPCSSFRTKLLKAKFLCSSIMLYTRQVDMRTCGYPRSLPTFFIHLFTQSCNFVNVT